MQSKNTLVNEDINCEGYLVLSGMIIKQAILDYLSSDLIVDQQQIEEGITEYKFNKFMTAISERHQSAQFLTNEHSFVKYFDLNIVLLLDKMIDLLLESTKREKYIQFLKWQKEMLKNKDWYKIDPPNVVWFEKTYIPEHAHECWSDKKGKDYGEEEESETHQRILEEAKRTFEDKEVLRNISGLLEKIGGKDW